MTRMEELLSSEESGKRPATARRRLAIAGGLIVLLVLALVLPPLVNLNKYRRQITASISEALGRAVYVGGMQLRLLPTPGIVMSDFTVEEDAAFGYEPALHANSVVASLRLTSLWRGRLEVSRISFDEVNLNLVRNSAGQWSIGSVLLRASQIPNAPTGERHAGARRRFPYIEASDARIDFKDGAEKKPFSLMNAEFSMWQSTGDEWQLRLEGQPVRTDLELHLSDAGRLRLDGSLGRADNLLAMPVDLHAEWSGAQLGQVSRLLTGADSGWRGSLNVSTTIRGRGGDLQLESRVQIGNLRRQEFQPANTVNVDATCRSEYQHAERLLGNVTCFWPVRDGHLLLTGRVRGFAPADADLQLEINQIPASFPVRLLGLMRANAQNVTATGTINGTFRLTTMPQPMLAGTATATGVALSYPGGSVTLPAMHWAAMAPHPEETKGKKVVTAAVTENSLLLEALDVPMGEAKPLVADASLTRSGFELHLAGEAAAARLMAAGRNFGLLENALAAAAPHGRATVDTTTTGKWMPPLAGSSSGIGTTGTLQVQNLELRPSFLRAPVEVESAAIDLTPDAVAWKNVALKYEGTAMHGSITLPVSCPAPGACAASFAWQPGTLNAAAVEGMVHGRAGDGLLGEILALGEGSPGAWPSLHGTVDCPALQVGRLTIEPAKAAITVDGAKLTIESLEGKALGGTLEGSGEMTVAGGTPQWKLDVKLTGARMSEAGAIFHEAWGAGTASGEAELTMGGYSAADLAASAAGDFAFTWQNGGLEGARTEAFARFDRWTGKGTIANRTLTLTTSEVSHGGKNAAVEGTIGFNRSVNLTVARRGGRVKVAGTLAEPGR